MIINLTPHVIDVYPADVPTTIDPLRHHPILSIAPEPVPARLAEAVVEEAVVYEKGSVPVSYVEYGHAEGLPEAAPWTFFVVSLPVALALPGRRDLLVPYRQVRNAAGAVVGCRGFAAPVPVG